MPVRIDEIGTRVDRGGGEGEGKGKGGVIDAKLVEQVAARVLALMREELRITAERRGTWRGR
jgi:hypothetical protein